MTHSDDDGLVLPPRLAPAHIVIIPVIHKDESKNEIISYCNNIATQLRKNIYFDRNIEVIIDTSERRGGEKVWSWIKKGIPIYCEVGPRDMASNSVFIGRRDKERKERISIDVNQFVDNVSQILDEIQQNLYQRALIFRNKHMLRIDSKKDFYDFFTPENKEKPEIHGGFAICHWNGSKEVEEIVKKELSVTIRCIPLDSEEEEEGRCIITGEPSKKRVIFAKSY